MMTGVGEAEAGGWWDTRRVEYVSFSYDSGSCAILKLDEPVLLMLMRIVDTI
jgi:hypothetical protein